MPRFLALSGLVLGLTILAISEDGFAAQAKRPAPTANGAEVTVSVAPDNVLRVRLLNLPGGGFDEKGNIKVMTSAEKLKAKGDTPAEQRLRGYKGGVDQLKPGDMVEVTLSSAKLDPKDKEKKVYSASGKPVVSGKLISADSKQIAVQLAGTYPAGAGVKKDGNKVTLSDSFPATMVVVTQEAAPSPSGKPPKNKKNN